MTNPLLADTHKPLFSRIKPEHIEPAIDTLLQQNRDTVAALLAEQREYTWDNLIAPLQDMDDRLNRTWSPVNHLHSVADTTELRAAYNACLPKLTDYATELGQNEKLFQAYSAIAEGPHWQQLDQARQKVISNALRDFRLSGVALEPDKRKQFKTIKQRLAKLETQFEENLLDATEGWHKQVTDQKQLDGLPETARELAAQTAQQKELQGWVFTLELPSYHPVMMYANDAALRREMYEAYTSRASETGPNAGKWDNSAVMTEILSLRQELAALLNFDNYAEYSLVRKMAETPQEVMDFLNDLAARSKPAAEKEYAELQEFARTEYKTTELHAWDVPWYSEKLRQKRFAFSQEQLRPWFPVPDVIKGMFSVVQRLYGIDIEAVDGVETWHEDVQFFVIKDSAGDLRGGFYLDLYARTGKRGGAWMDECVVRKRNEQGLQTPIAYLTCNFTPPLAGKPSLLTHDEVTTLFHEFGHGLHHLLTRIDYPDVAGINGVPWDAVELPSQFMENWCWERESLDLFARHHETGAPLPPDLFDKMRSARTFQAGMHTVRQLELSLFDFRLHAEKRGRDSADVQALLNAIRDQVAVIKAPPNNRFQHSFSHIFAGGYGAGYYSYKWAEVLSADAFSRFEETGIFNEDTGQQFLGCILEQGGARDPMELFVEFRGRRPTIDALLRHSGLLPQ
ncbi:MAG: oligopeptidase A [Gammaproteobacteria bacterium]